MSGLKDMDSVAGISRQERYTYLFDGNSQELDHVFVSEAVARKDVRFEHVHVNSWAGSQGEVSDHDPSVMRVNVC